MMGREVWGEREDEKKVMEREDQERYEKREDADKKWRQNKKWREK